MKVLAKIAIAITLLFGFIIYQIKNTQWNLQKVHHEIDVGDSIIDLLRDPVFFGKALPNKRSHIWAGKAEKLTENCFTVRLIDDKNIHLHSDTKDQNVDLSVVKFAANIDSYRHFLADCSELVFHFGGWVPYSALLTVQYDKDFKKQSHSILNTSRT